jgi:hypothetical protein
MTAHQFLSYVRSPGHRYRRRFLDQLNGPGGPLATKPQPATLRLYPPITDSHSRWISCRVRPYLLRHVSCMFTDHPANAGACRGQIIFGDSQLVSHPVELSLELTVLQAVAITGFGELVNALA